MENKAATKPIERQQIVRHSVRRQHGGKAGGSMHHAV